MAIFGKLAYTAGVSPDALLLLRFGLAAALLGLLLRPFGPRFATTVVPGVSSLTACAAAAGPASHSPRRAACHPSGNA